MALFRGRPAALLLPRLLATLLLLSSPLSSVVIIASAQPCPNMCSGHGNCAQRVCYCWQGWQGADCSERTCPSDTAWADRAVADDDAHRTAECSNMGTCDRSSGQCQCRPGFDGHACSRLACPNDCSMHGVCQDMSHFASTKDPGSGTVFAYENVWDSDMIHGCHCDDGFFGPDCSLRHCPRGDDPLTGTAIDPSGTQRNEVQTLFCRATGGTFTLTFRGSSTDYINFDDSLSDLKEKLLVVPTVSGVSVEGLGSAVCSAAGETSTITFTQEFGDLPLMVGNSEALFHSVRQPKLRVREEASGTKEDAYCANRGLCNTKSGVCDCFDHFATSDGYGDRGQRGDCGYPESGVTACPGEISCSGHGICYGYPTYTCQCANGWQGPDCSERSCPLGKPWFGLPTADDTAHSSLSLVECSNQGTCDRQSGRCVCASLFEGAACDRLSCPGAGGEGAGACSGHGRCLSMQALADNAAKDCDDEYCHFGNPASVTYGRTPNKADTWDHDMVQGCLCDNGWQGYDCSERTCPYGDDPHTPYEWLRYSKAKQKHIYRDQVNEVQSLVCTASSGSFRLAFRGEETSDLTYDVTKRDLETALESLGSIVDVSLSLTGSSGGDDDDSRVCSSAGTTTVSIEFLVPTGDVPLIKYAVDGVADITVAEEQAGTKEYKECSGRGLCDRASGECQCFAGFGSSDGQGRQGDRGDCGYSKVYSGRLDDAVSCKSSGDC